MSPRDVEGVLAEMEANGVVVGGPDPTDAVMWGRWEAWCASLKPSDSKSHFADFYGGYRAGVEDVPRLVAALRAAIEGLGEMYVAGLSRPAFKEARAEQMARILALLTGQGGA